MEASWNRLVIDLDWATILTVLSVLALLGAFWRKWVHPFLRRIGDFLDDWNGEQPRPGHDGRPGVPERLAAIESEQKRVRKEVEHNGGGSLKDAVKRVEEQQARDRDVLDTLTNLVGAFLGREQVARIEGHKAQAELFQTMQQINENGGE